MSRLRALSPYEERLPLPHNVEAEQALLGALLIDNRTFDRVSSALRPEHFSEAIHAKIYEAIASMISSGREASPITLKGLFGPGEIEGLGLTGHGYVIHLFASAVGTDIASYADRVLTLATQRALMAAADDIREMAALAAPGTRAAELIRDCEARFAEAIDGRAAPGEANPVDEMMADLAAAMARGGTDGIPWCLREVLQVIGDELEFGWLVGVLADSGGGKTSFALQQAAHAVSLGYPVLFLSGDQAPKEVIRQIVSQSVRAGSGDMRRGRLSEDEYRRVATKADEVRRWPLDIRRISRPTTAEIAMWVRAWRRKRGRRGLVIIDHAKRLQATDRRAMLAEGVNQIYGDLKALMQETDNVGLILMQRNTDGAKRDNPRPNRGDVYGGSSAIESLDACLALYVEEHWTKSRLEMARTDKQREEIRERAALMMGKAELIGLKARFARANECRVVKREAEFTRFASLADDWRSDAQGLDL